MLLVVWRSRARQDYRAIIDYISDRNTAAAERMADLFDRTVECLSDHPDMYRPGRVSGTREAVMHPNYVMVYRVIETSIEITAIQHTRQQYP